MSSDESLTLSPEMQRLREITKRLLTIPYCPHTPTAKQSTFLLNFDLEALYGGAAGGGKSDALLMGALQFCHVPGYAAIIFRRTFQDLKLPGALMDRSFGWLGGSDARWSSQDKAWYFPADSVIQFAYMEHENDKLRYQSAEFQYVAFDETTQFSESQYRYMFSRVRRPKGASGALARVPLRVRGGTNPGGPGHDWVKRRFIDTTAPGRHFVPATLEDNPHLDADEYEKSLANLDPITYRQLRRGDWIRPVGGLFDRTKFKILDAPPAGGTRVRYWDFAATEAAPGKDPDWTVGAKMSRTPQGMYVVEDVVRFQGAPAEVEAALSVTAAVDGREIRIGFEEEGGSSGKIVSHHYVTKVLPGYAAEGIRSTGDKVSRAKPLSAQAAVGNIALVRGEWNDTFLDEAEAFPLGSHDDQIDAVSGAFAMLAASYADNYMALIAPACPACGLPNAKTANTCKRCGKPLASST